MILSPELECMNREDLRVLQFARLKNLIEKIYANVPFYKEKFDALGLKPSDIRCLEDIKTSFYYERRSTANLSLWFARCSTIRNCRNSHVIWNDGLACCKCLYTSRYGPVDGGHGTNLECCWCNAKRYRKKCLWLRIIYRWNGCSLRYAANRCNRYSYLFWA